MIKKTLIPLIIALFYIPILKVKSEVIQQNFAVIDAIGSNKWYDMLDSEEVFGNSIGTYISGKCSRISLSEDNFNELLSNGAKVIAVSDQNLKKNINFIYLDSLRRMYMERGYCSGISYILEADKKVLKNTISRIKNNTNLLTPKQSISTFVVNSEGNYTTELLYTLYTQFNKDGEVMNYAEFQFDPDKFPTTEIIILKDDENKTVEFATITSSTKQPGPYEGDLEFFEGKWEKKRGPKSGYEITLNDGSKLFYELLLMKKDFK